VARILMPLRLIHISAPYVTKVLVFQKIVENILKLLICTAFWFTFLLVKLLQVAYIPRPFEGFVVHPFEIECSQSGL
jgi:predicted ferric reductase